MHNTISFFFTLFEQDLIQHKISMSSENIFLFHNSWTFFYFWTDTFLLRSYLKRIKASFYLRILKEREIPSIVFSSKEYETQERKKGDFFFLHTACQVFSWKWPTDQNSSIFIQKKKSFLFSLWISLTLKKKLFSKKIHQIFSKDISTPWWTSKYKDTELKTIFYIKRQIKHY